MLAMLGAGSSCTKDMPRGTIKPSPVTAKAGEVKELTLDLPLRYDAVSREYWEVKPASLGKVHFDEAEPRRRSATFAAKAAGSGTIYVRGLYGDNPKPVPIAETPVVVSP